MGDCRPSAPQSGVTVRDRMENLCNNPDMADLHIQASDDQWMWGQTSKDFIGHKLVLCTASPVFHQLFFPSEGGPEIPRCLTLSKAGGATPARLEIQGVPPVAVEALLDYCYKDNFCRGDYENGYSRNLLWRLWQLAHTLGTQHLFQMCTEALHGTMCEESVFWDLNYSIQYWEIGTEEIRLKVNQLMSTLGNQLYTHPNFVFLDRESIRAMLSTRIEASSEPVVIFNNVLRWCLYQLDRTLCDEVDGQKDADIPLTERTRVLHKIRQEKVKEFTWSDIHRHLEQVLDLVPWREFSQSEFLEFVVPSDVLSQEMLVSASLAVMAEAVANPERITKSAFLFAHDPNTVKSELNKAMAIARSKSDLGSTTGSSQSQSPGEGRKKAMPASPRPKGDIKSTLEAARQRRLAMEQRSSKEVEQETKALQAGNLLLVE